MTIAGSQYTIDFTAEATEAPFVDANWTNIENTFQNTNGTGLRPSNFFTCSMKHVTPATVNLVKAKFTISTNQAAFSDMLGALICDNTSGAGYIFQCNGNSGSFRRRDIGTGAGSLLTGFTITTNPGDEYELWYNKANGELSAVVNNSVISTFTDTTYQASTLAVGLFADAQNNNGRRVGLFGADYADSAVTIDSTPADIRVNESRTIRVTVPTTAMTTGNTTVKVNNSGNDPITPSAVTNISGLTYDVAFTVPDTYEGLAYSTTGYPIIVTATDGSVTSSNVDFLPVTGNDYVVLTAAPGDFGTSLGTLAIGDIIEWETNSGEITVNADATITSTNPNTTFEARAWDATDSTYGAWALQTLGTGGGGGGADGISYAGLSSAGISEAGLSS